MQLKYSKQFDICDPSCSHLDDKLEEIEQWKVYSWAYMSQNIRKRFETTKQIFQQIFTSVRKRIQQYPPIKQKMCRHANIYRIQNVKNELLKFHDARVERQRLLAQFKQHQHLTELKPSDRIDTSEKKKFLREYEIIRQTQEMDGVIKRREEKIKENERLVQDQLKLQTNLEVKMALDRRRNNVIKWQEQSQKSRAEISKCKERESDNKADVSKFADKLSVYEEQLVRMASHSIFKSEKDNILETKRKVTANYEEKDAQMKELLASLETSISEQGREMDCLDLDSLAIDSEMKTLEEEIAHHSATLKRVTIPYYPNQREMKTMHLLKAKLAQLRAQSIDTKKARNAILEKKNELQNHAREILIELASACKHREALEVDISKEIERLSSISETKTRTLQAHLDFVKNRI